MPWNSRYRERCSQSARRIGFVIHWILMGTIAFRLGYAVVFVAVGSAAWLVGALAGLVHGAAVGLVFMPMMPAMHPRMSAAPSTASPATASEVQLSAPGVFGSHWGAMTPVGLLAGHVVYGAVVALVYGLFV